MKDRDSYGYQGLAELYIDWAKNVSDVGEETLYLSKKRELQYMFSPLFTPSVWNIESSFVGLVKYVGGGFSKILLDGYSEVTCSSSKVNDVVLRQNDRVEVDLKFNIKGPIAFIKT